MEKDRKILWIAVAVVGLLAAVSLVVTGVSLYQSTSETADEVEESHEEEPSPAPVETPRQEDSSGGTTGSEPVDISSFNGEATTVGPWNVEVAEAYVDEDGYITDGGAFHDQAPEGMEYHIFNVNITNTGDAPATFDTTGTTGTGSDGSLYTNDGEAEFTVSDDYLGEELNPGASTEADVIFLLPEGASLSEVTVSGEGELTPGN